MRARRLRKTSDISPSLGLHGKQLPGETRQGHSLTLESRYARRFVHSTPYAMDAPPSSLSPIQYSSSSTGGAEFEAPPRRTTPRGNTGPEDDVGGVLERVPERRASRAGPSQRGRSSPLRPSQESAHAVQPREWGSERPSAPPVSPPPARPACETSATGMRNGPWAGCEAAEEEGHGEVPAPAPAVPVPVAKRARATRPMKPTNHAGRPSPDRRAAACCVHRAGRASAFAPGMRVRGF